MGNKAEFYLSAQMIADAIRALPEDVKILTFDVGGVHDSIERRIHVHANSEEEVERIAAPYKPVYEPEVFSETVNLKRWHVDHYRGEDVTIHGVLFMEKGEDENAEEG